MQILPWIASLFSIESTICPSQVCDLNKEILDSLQALSTTTLYKFYKANLNKDCLFWNEQQLCNLRDCTVVESQEDQIPVKWRKASLSGVSGMNSNPFGLNLKQINPQDFCVIDDELDEEGSYINLLENPERYTGYAGESAKKVWGAIYNENCFGFQNELESAASPNINQEFQQEKQICTEEEVFYKLVSGLHTSISIHICGEWLDRTNGVWIKNETCYKERIFNHPERLDNLYFLWAVMERALSKSLLFLEKYTFTQGLDDSGQIIKYTNQLIETIRTNPSRFDESILFLNDQKVIKLIASGESVQE